MQLSCFDYYVIGINILGFILFAINTWLYTYTPDKEIDRILTIVSFLGASLGIFISTLIFDRNALKSKQKKEIMMSRVFLWSILIIQIIIFLIIKGHIKNNITIAFWTFFAQHKIFLLYLLIINIITLIAFGVDKIKALEHRSRIRIITLLSLAFVVGSIGGLIAMYSFKHKVKQDYFSVGLPLILIMQVIVIFYLMNGKLQ